MPLTLVKRIKAELESKGLESLTADMNKLEEAALKATPRRVINVRKVGYSNAKIGYCYCGNTVCNVYDKYCAKCGQKLDYGVDENEVSDEPEG